MSARPLRLAIAAGVVSAVSAVLSAAQVSSTSSTGHCIKRLLVPAYPLVARTSNSSATLRVDVGLNAEGSVQSQQFQILADSKNRSLFQSAIERALKASAFEKACGGRTIRLTFRFKMGGPDAVWFEYPDTYEITAMPPPLNTTGRKKL